MTLQRIRRELQILQAFFARDRTRDVAPGVSGFAEDILTVLELLDSRRDEANCALQRIQSYMSPLKATSHPSV